MQTLPFAILCAFLLCAPSFAQLEALNRYVGLNRPVRIGVELPGATPGEGAGVPEVHLIDAGSGDVLGRAPVAEGLVDLGAMLPVLWTSRQPRVMYAQLFVGSEALGAPLVIQPLLTARESQDQLGAAIEEAFRRGDIEQIRDLAALAPERKAQLRQQVRVPEGEREFVGLRLWRDRHIVFETTAGELELRLRPEHAPNTVYHVLGLAEGGLYDGTIFHRIINSDGQGRRFIIQGGDPLGLGSGGPGFRIDYEPSSLTHDYGVVSLARRPFEPNSGGSQFFICLSREACSALDGAYTAFAEVVRGVETIETLSRVPVGPLDPDDPSSRMERPLDPPRIVRARVIDAPPLPLAPQRVSEPVSAGER